MNNLAKPSRGGDAKLSGLNESASCRIILVRIARLFLFRRSISRQEREKSAARTQEERRKNSGKSAGRTAAITWERHNTTKRTKRTKRMNERIKNRIKLVSSFLMCVLSLSAAITLSFAWFAKNDTVNGGGMSVAIENDANVVGAEYFIAEKNGSNNGSTQLKFKKITNEPVRMGAYDILDKKYQLLAKVYLKSDMETIRVTGNTQTAYFLGALENNKSKYPLLPPSSDVNVPQESTAGGVTYTNVLSSVINFTIFQAGELTALTNGSGYELVSDTLPSGDRIAKFIADSATATAPTPTINLVQTEGIDTVTTGEAELFNGQPCRTLFIMFSYDEAIMEKIFSDNLGNKNIYVESNGVLLNIPFKCDFTISFEKFAG